MSADTTSSPITIRLMDTIDELRAEVALMQSSISAANYRANVAEERLAEVRAELETQCNCGKVSA
jgi:hypothetical protein